MEKHKVWREVPKDKVPDNAKVVTSTWEMKNKSTVIYQARLNACGFEQHDQDHYDGSKISAPVTKEATVHIVMTLMVLEVWSGQVFDMKGAFLHGEFKEGEEVYMGVPQVFKDLYPPNVVSLLLKTIYGIKRAAMAYWKIGVVPAPYETK